MTEVDRASDHDSKSEWFYADGVPGVGARPDYLSDKYKSLADQAKAHRELEKRLGSQGTAPEAYDFGELADAIDTKNPHINEFLTYAKEQKLSQDAFSKTIKTFVDYDKSRRPDFSKELEKLGPDGGRMYDTVSQWAKNRLSKDAVAAIDEMPKTAKTIKMLDELRQLQYHTSTKLPIENTNTQFTALTVADVQNEMITNYSRYQNDPKYRAELTAKFAQAVGE